MPHRGVLGRERVRDRDHRRGAGRPAARPRRSRHVGGHEASVCASRAARAEQRVGSGRRSAAPRVRPPPCARRQRRRHVLEPVDARDLLDQVDLARHVEPARLGARTSQRRRRRAARSRGGRGSRRPRQRRPRRRSPRRRGPRAARPGALGQIAAHVDRLGRHARAARARPAAAPRRGSRPARARGSTPFSKRFEPSVRRPSRCDVRMIEPRSKFAASSTTVVASSLISASAPPMMPGDARRPLGVGDHERLGVELAPLAVERRSSPRRRVRAARRARAPRMRARS